MRESGDKRDQRTWEGGGGVNKNSNDKLKFPPCGCLPPYTSQVVVTIPVCPALYNIYSDYIYD